MLRGNLKALDTLSTVLLHRLSTVGQIHSKFSAVCLTNFNNSNPMNTYLLLLLLWFFLNFNNFCIFFI